ncbi:hypothetical protein TVAG_237520 [Trichomonas vaginalis G3]|uniref:Uncharacterized protein n=1 Tax=Trichomonas vaginalis (strain ATCC PRA-98 / G3) TaxID=412133 RepID=A2DCV2_TRIV3|nr:hypothetical protein TVAGG3_0606760 [Trichomonas vaginalis G3]EAY21726.1 hypothetical protein TVAG_237520 [Trichomonas vaginalis G3]KAI5524301.1 hypothetical protein TVAGG3_0606760 [Trichomonas vaginalis G3]|eukprot:XP_001582712.1 hypothetical protein [Trichomonas vaginalis G3]
MIVTILGFQNLMVQPWYIIPYKNDTIKRFLCKGWSCEASNYKPHQLDEFDDVINSYINGTYESNLERKLIQFISRGYYPAYCAAGLFAMTGLGNFTQNLTRSYIMLNKGAEYGLWSCFDTLTFHPFTENPFEFSKIAMKYGGVWSTIYYALENIKQNGDAMESLEILSHVETGATSGWWKKRRSGKAYANALSVIMNMTEGNVQESWETMLNLSRGSNLPAALWVADGYKTGEIGRVDPKEGVKNLIPYLSTGPWRIDVASIIESNETVNKTLLFDIASKIGNNYAQAISSFPQIY